MNRRDVLKAGVAGAIAAGMHPAWARMGRGGGIAQPSVLNPIWVNFDAGGGGWRSGGGMPIFKNRVRESRGFTLTTDNITQTTLSAAGWPTTDFSCVLFDGANIQPCYQGTFKCGFIGTGSETVASYANCSVANVVHGTGGAYTTFDLTPTAGVFGFKVTGTTSGVTNVFAYLPAYPASTIDDPTNVNSITAEAVNFYSQFGGIRFMWFQDAADWCIQSTSANRNTASNFQAYQGEHNQPALAFASAPGVGATSALLAVAWARPTGTYFLSWAAAGSVYYGRICALTNGSTAVSWATTDNRALTSTDAPTGTGFSTGWEDFPVDWAVTLCNACNIGMRIQTPCLEDGTNYSTGSWSSSVMDMLNSRWTSKGRVEFAMGNENWNSAYKPKYILNELQALYSATYTDLWHYYAYRLNAFATLGRTKFGANWGSKFVQVLEYQAILPHNFWNILTAYSTYGTVTADLVQGDIAPYCNPTVGNTDSVATIESEATTAAQSCTANNSESWCEATAITLMHFGLRMGTYEGGFQWNNGYSGVTNLGATIMDSNYQTCVSTLYNAVFNAGIDPIAGIRHFQEGITTGNGATQPVDSFTTSYANRNSAPTLLALQQFMNASSISITRNVITSAGATVAGANYARNNVAFDDGSADLGNKNTPNPSNYGIAYLLYSAVARTVALSANFTNSGAAGSTQLEYGNAANGATVLGGGTPTSVSIPTGTNTVSIGSFPVVAGWNYIVLGNPSTAQSSILVNSLTAN